jgi:hypothetical protein
MQLNEREASLVDAFRRLPPETATELSALAERFGPHRCGASMLRNQRTGVEDRG